MNIKEKISKIQESFSGYDLWEDKYKYLISLGKDLSPMSVENRIDKYLVKGCQSQVWLSAKFTDGKVFYETDSDALIVKGISGILVGVYSQETPKTILETEATFLQDIGITEHLSMNRTNGLASILKSIKLYAQAFSAMESIK